MKKAESESNLTHDDIWRILLNIRARIIPVPYVFPGNFSTTQRKYVHFGCAKLGLRSGSSGKRGVDRAVSVTFKPFGRVDVAENVSVSLSSAALSHVTDYLASTPRIPRPVEEKVQPRPPLEKSLRPLSPNTLISRHMTAEFDQLCQNPIYLRYQTERSRYF
jgi:hypothetical protein